MISELLRLGPASPCTCCPAGEHRPTWGDSGCRGSPRTEGRPSHRAAPLLLSPSSSTLWGSCLVSTTSCFARQVTASAPGCPRTPHTAFQAGPTTDPALRRPLRLLRWLVLLSMQNNASKITVFPKLTCVSVLHLKLSAPSASCACWCFPSPLFYPLL